MKNDLFEKFKASHKRLTNFADIFKHAGNLETALAGWNLNDLAAIHAYDGGCYIIEQQVDDLRLEAVHTHADGLFVFAPFSLELCNESWAAATLDELEPKLFEWWRDEVHPYGMGAIANPNADESEVAK